MLHTFADHAPRMQAAGWAVLPAAGKSPIRKGFNTWRFRPSAKIIDKWAKEAPDADIVYVPGLCATKLGKRSLIVVDPDDAEAIGQAEELFGDTPGKVRSRRGAHRLYDGAGLDLGNVTSLRPYGFNIDLKHGQRGAGIVVGPPSAHDKDRSFRYAWDGCDETVIRDLPPFPIDKLKALLDKQQPAPAKELRDGSRKQECNRYLVSRVCYCADFDELLDVARTWNEDLRDHGYEPLEDTILIRRARVVWQHHQQGRFVPMLKQGGIARSPDDEIDTLARLNPKIAGDAHMLIARLRIKHSARCKRGGTFAICAPAMERDQVILGWTRARYENARDLLLAAQLLKCVSPFHTIRGVHHAAQYTL